MTGAPTTGASEPSSTTSRSGTTKADNAAGCICYVVAHSTLDVNDQPTLRFWPDMFMEAADAVAEIHNRLDDGDDQLWNRRVLKVVAL